MKKVTIYTDGSCLSNPGGAGGWVAIILPYDGARREIYGGVRLSTSNRMELLAVIKGLECLPEPSSVMIITDSVYVVYSVRRVYVKRRRTNYMNPDLLERLNAACARHKVFVSQVRGHVGNQENENADFLAGRAARGANLGIDGGFESKPLEAPRVEQLILECDAD